MTPAASTSLITLLLLWDSCSAAETDPAPAAAALFDVYCFRKSADFAQLDQRATEAHYEVLLERNMPMPDGAVTLTFPAAPQWCGGPHELAAVRCQRTRKSCSLAIYREWRE